MNNALRGSGIERTLLVFLVSALVILVACGEGEVAPAQLPEQTGDTQQAEAEQEKAPEEEPESDEFDIVDREQAAARLSYLYDLLSDGNPINDPIGWAKGGAASLRIQEICNDFDISEDLDPACDQLLIAIETPFNQMAPVLSAASSELRSIIPRRKLAEYLDLTRKWDGDISEWKFSAEWLGILRRIKDVMDECTRYEFSCSRLPQSVRAFTDALGTLTRGEQDTDDLITIAVVADLSEDLIDYVSEDSAYGRQLDARRIANELEDLGIY